MTTTNMSLVLDRKRGDVFHLLSCPEILKGGCQVGIHGGCGGVAMREDGRFFARIWCRSCGEEIHFPRSIETVEELKSYLRDHNVL